MYSIQCTRHAKEFLVFLVILLGVSLAYGQSEPEEINAILKDEILAPAVAEFQI